MTTNQQHPIEFGKMQCLLTGNRFSGVNIHKTRYDFDQRPSVKMNGLSLTIVLTVEVDYLEVEDKVKYLQHATYEIPQDVFKAGNTLQFLKDAVTSIQNELIRRFEKCQIFKFLEFKEGPDQMTDIQLTERLMRVISDYKNSKT